jgi:hypothetical protein
VARAEQAAATAAAASKASKAVPAAASAAPAAAARGVQNVTKPITNPEELIAKITDLRTKNGFSGAQIAAALKQWHGIPMREARQAVKLVLGEIK